MSESELRDKVLSWLFAEKRSAADIQALGVFGGLRDIEIPCVGHPMTIAYHLANLAAKSQKISQLRDAIAQWNAIEKEMR